MELEVKDMDRPTGAKDRLAELVSAREEEMAPQRAVALPILEKAAYVLIAIVGVPLFIVIGSAMALLIPAAAAVACAGLAPSSVFSLLARVINRRRYPARLKIALPLLASPSGCWPASCWSPALPTSAFYSQTPGRAGLDPARMRLRLHCGLPTGTALN